MVTLGLYTAVLMPPAENWALQKEVALVFTSPARILLASIIGYFFGEYVNSFVLSKFKIIMKGKYYPVRVILSTSIGSVIDSILFCSLSFHGILPFSYNFV